MVITSPEQLWVSDITYIRTLEGFSYLSLITDAYSRKIVGNNILNKKKRKNKYLFDNIKLSLFSIEKEI